jgi:hypothetical protein
MTSASPRTLKPTIPMGGAMFEPALSPKTLLPQPSRSPITAGHLPERLGELHNPKDRATFDEFGHAHIAPTDTDTGRRLGLPPFTV